MPALPSVPNVLKADLAWSLPGAPLINTRNYFRYSGGAPTSTDATALAADIYSAMSGHATLWSDDVNFTNVQVTDLSSPSGGQGEHAQSTLGSRGASDLSAQVCVLVNYLISRRYRGGKPRSYFPWFNPVDVSTPTSWAPSALTEVDSALSAYFAACIGSTSGSTTITEHVNVSYYQGFTVVTSPTTHRAKNVPTLRPVPVVDVISSFAASARIATQRRRMGR